MNKDTVFPQYRKLNNGKAYYKIVSENEFEELQIMGSKVFYHKFKVEQYPDLLRIKDMIDLYEGLFELVDEEVYQKVYSRI
jgi:hypothetical protein